MPKRGTGSLDSLLAALREQQLNQQPGRVPSGLAQNAYLSDMPLTGEQEREQGILDAQDTRVSALSATERKSQEADAARRFATRTGVQESGMGAALPFTEATFPPMASHASTLPVRKITKTPAIQPSARESVTTEFGISPQTPGVRTFRNTMQPIDPEAAAGERGKALLDPRVLAAQVQFGTGIGSAGTGAIGVTGPKALEGADPQTAQLVKSLTDYKYPLPSGMALRTPQWQRILALATEYDPTFDATQYTARQKLRSDFTSGQGARNIRSLNTAVGHLSTLTDKADALSNFSVPLANTVKNYVKTATGNPSVVEFQNAANAVESELANAFKGTGATDQEIKAWRANLSAAQSPEQLHGAINTAIELLGSRLDALQGQWEKGMGKVGDFGMLTDRSKGILDHLKSGASSGGGGVTITSITPVP